MTNEIRSVGVFCPPRLHRCRSSSDSGDYFVLFFYFFRIARIRRRHRKSLETPSGEVGRRRCYIGIYVQRLYVLPEVVVCPGILYLKYLYLHNAISVYVLWRRYRRLICCSERVLVRWRHRPTRGILQY